MLEIKNLHVSYGTHHILKEINLKIAEGKIIGVLGKNGAGKTTLFDSIYQNKKYTGEILWQNCMINRKSISYVETENYFYPYITGEEYLNYFSKNIKIKDFAEKFNLPLKKHVQDYSSGMKKKLALLSMILLDKPINILDEPFNGVDFEGVHILYEIINNLKSENKIVIISSHIIETLFNSCDEIIILQEGTIQKIFQKNEFDNLKGYIF